MAYYPLPHSDLPAFWQRSGLWAGVAGLHVLALLLVSSPASKPDPETPPVPMDVRLIEAQPVSRVSPAPLPALPAAVPPRVERLPRAPQVPLSPRPVASADTRPAPVTPAPLPPSDAIGRQAPASAPSDAAPAPVSAPAASPVTAPRFDADYLQNPKPLYPPLSRRLGEEGKVLLRVRVSAQGEALAVEINRSSGFARLDEAARITVARWRFVPARQGGEALESSVLVPLTFALDN